MADTPGIVTSNWQTPTLEAFEAANPHLLNHSSRIVIDPEVNVTVNPQVNTVNQLSK